jgi:transposase InsO family protein
MPCGSGHWRSKPDWVKLAVFDLALGLPGAGYRTIAHCFNLQQAEQQSQQTAHGKTEIASVSKTFVAKLLTSQRAALAQARQRARSRSQARREPIQTTWGIDLTGLPLTDGSSVPVFGVIDHGSRAIVALEPVATYNSLILLGKLLIGVRQQFTDLGSPWQNGRIESFWRTLKSELKKPAGLTWQVDLRTTKLLIYMVSACKASRHAGWRGVDTTDSGVGTLGTASLDKLQIARHQFSSHQDVINFSIWPHPHIPIFNKPFARYTARNDRARKNNISIDTSAKTSDCHQTCRTKSVSVVGVTAYHHDYSLLKRLRSRKFEQVASL